MKSDTKKTRSPWELADIFDRWMKQTGDRDQAIVAVYNAGLFDADRIRIAARRRLKDQRAVDMTTRAAPYLEAIGELRGVEPSRITSTEKNTALCRVRHELMWVLRVVEDMSYPEIAMALGLKDHTSVLYGVAKIEANATAVERDELLKLVEADEGAGLRAVG